MFRSTGLFGEVRCPQGANCSLLNCIFSHSHLESPTKDGSAPTTDVLYDPASVNRLDEPPLKRRRLSHSDDEAVDDTKETQFRPAPRSKALLNDDSTQETKSKTVSTKQELVDRKPPKSRNSPVTITRAVSPPPSRFSRKLAETRNERSSPLQRGAKVYVKSITSPKESLNPRLLTPNPAPHPVRLAILKKIHEQLTRLNDEALKDQATKEFVLSETEVISMALDEEEKMAKENPQIYKNVVGHRIQRLKKMKLDEWKSSLLKDFQDRYLPPKLALKPKEMAVETGLTAQQEIAVLTYIVTPLQGLEAHGYVTSAPTPEEVKVAEDGLKAAGGFERCDRCGTRFQVFPGRNSDETSRSFGRLTSTENGCTYHWSKPFRPPKSSAAGAGEQESYYPCCRGAMGSKGCTEASDHVFKASEVKRMASMLQFQSTPWPEDPDRPRGPVTFDCEMGYTTLGMELIRLTAVSWPQNQNLLDILVRPLGEVIDYNTRFSGVSQELFSKALPYGAKKPDQDDPTSEDGELEQEPLCVVGSPMAARKLLFDLLTPETHLIGHAIDNDLNTCRVIHPTIVDTVLLFPHPRGLPIRYGLKMLTGKYLERSIQTGGALGHDSKEDAKATGDLVRFKVGEKWKHLRLQRWTFQGEKLVPPPETTMKKIPEGPRTLKRSASQLDGEREESESATDGKE